MNQLERFRPVVTFQLLANRLAFNRHGVPSGYSLRAETRALDAALDRAGHDGPFDVVGHSAGGTLALDYALTHPERVRSLTLIEPGLVWLLRATGGLTKAMEVQLRRRAKQYVARQTKVSYERFFREIYLEKGFDPTASPLLWPLLCAYMHNMPFRMALLRHVDDPARLRAAACPLWIVQGAESDDLHRTGMRVLRDCWPHARLTVLPGGHVPHSGPRLPGFLGHLSRFHRSVAAASRSRPVARAEPRTQPAGHRSETGVVIHG